MRENTTSQTSGSLPGGAASAAPDTEAFMAAMNALGGLNLPAHALADVQGRYLQDAANLWNRTLQSLQAGAGAPPAPDGVKIDDRRFAAADWSADALGAFNAQMYLLNARALTEMVDRVDGADAKTRRKLRFAVQQWIDAAAPSNYLALNPEALRKALETKGESIAKGVQQLIEDMRQGHMSQTDESVFEVGVNVATSQGGVVFENELFQLIEYKPLTAQVFERPMLFVPPCINKYYILDLQPENSVIRYTVEQGHRLFVISWRNPDPGLAQATWDRYIEDAAICAIERVREISGSDKINALGFCVGGTILSTALAVLAARGQRPVASLTLLTTLLDFSDTGVLDVFIDEPMVRLREMTLGPDSPGGGNLLRGQELATTFSFLRPNDLVWNYVVGNYLKGEKPPAFDLLYWNSDSTNLPGPMFCWYLRNMYLENKLVQPRALKVCGEPIDLRSIKLPAYVYASREDHIVPWDAAYRNTQVLAGKVRFVLGASGHIAGVINPPAKGKRSHWMSAGATLPESPQRWLESATETPGSWWPDWARWLQGHAGAKVAAPKSLGNRKFKVIEPAPGRYVKQKA
jgi:polyhydroxyalkanoate synthase subunit PhaC